MNPKAVAGSKVVRVSLNMPSPDLLELSCPFATSSFARGPFCFQHRIARARLGMNPKAVAGSKVVRVSLNMPSPDLLELSCPFATSSFARGPFCFQHRIARARLGMNPKAVAGSKMVRVSLNMPSPDLLELSCPFRPAALLEGRSASSIGSQQ